MHDHPQNPRVAIRILTCSRGLSTLGGEAGYIALMAIIWARTHDPRWTSGVIVAAVMSGTIAGPLLGVFVDRLPRRRIMVIGEFVAAVFVGSMAFAREPIELLVLSVLVSITCSPLDACLQAAVPEVVADSDLPWANSVSGATQTTGSLLGPLLGGALVAGPGAPIVFLVHAALRAGAAGMLLRVRVPLEPRQHVRAALDRGWRAVGGGAAILRGDSALMILLGAWALMCTGFGITTAADLPLAAAIHAGPSGYGLFVAAFAAGGLAGAIPARRIGERWQGAGPLVWTSVVCGAGLAVVALASGLAGAMAGMVVLGAALAVSGTVDQAIIQRRTPQSHRGRVTSCTSAVVGASFGLGLALGGPLAIAVGPHALFAAGAACQLLSVPCMLALQRMLAANPPQSVRASLRRLVHIAMELGCFAPFGSR